MIAKDDLQTDGDRHATPLTFAPREFAAVTRSCLLILRLPSARAAGQARSPVIQFLSPLEIAYCCAVMVASYALRGSTGFGAAAAMPLLALVVPLKVLIPAWTLVGLVASVSLFGRDRLTSRGAT